MPELNASTILVVLVLAFVAGFGWGLGTHLASGVVGYFGRK